MFQPPNLKFSGLCAPGAGAPFTPCSERRWPTGAPASTVIFRKSPARIFAGGVRADIIATVSAVAKELASTPQSRQRELNETKRNLDQLQQPASVHNPRSAPKDTEDIDILERESGFSCKILKWKRQPSLIDIGGRFCCRSG